MKSSVTPDEQRQTEELFQRVAADVGMIIDRPIVLQSVEVERSTGPAIGRGSIHISFKLGFQQETRIAHGALLVPLSEAITLGSYLMMLTDTDVQARRGLQTLDAGLKDALMEVGNFVGGAADAALRGLGLPAIKVRSEGCQGVQAGVRPALVHGPGEEFLVGRARLAIHSWPPFEALAILPLLSPAAASPAPS